MKATGPLSPAATAASSQVGQKEPRRYGVCGGAAAVKSPEYAKTPMASRTTMPMDRILLMRSSSR
ncbi:hypothetical protein GCM10020254_28300 [Streptomyces goshikiensis]